MQPSRAIDAFAADRVRQHAAFVAGQAVGERWHARADVKRLVAALDTLCNDPPADVTAFGAAVQPFMADRRWLAAALDDALAAVAADPFVALPWRLLQRSVLGGAALIVRDGAHVALQWVDAAQLAKVADTAVTFSFGMTLMLVLRASGLRVADYRLEPGPDGDRAALVGQRSLADGDVLVADNGWQATQMLGAGGDALLLSFSFGMAQPGRPIRVFDAGTGDFMRSGTSDSDASRLLPLLALPRVAGQRRGGDVFARLVRHRDRTLRWQSMREWLALDAAAALPALTAMAASDADAGVRTTAQQTLALVAPCRNAA
jgi:hypothetical protein